MAVSAPSDPILLARRRAVSRARGRRRLTLLACGIGLVGAVAGYQALKASSVFAVRSIVVHGGSPALDAQVRAAMAGQVSGRNLLAVNTSPLENALLRMPYVKAVRVDRAFPNTLAITVVPEHPAMVAQSGGSAWLIASDGRVLAPARHPHHIPRAILPKNLTLTIGSVAADHDLSVALRALRETAAFTRQVGGLRRILSQPDLPLTIVLRHGLQVRLGTPDQLGLKLQVAGRVLGRMSSGERHSLAYVDVSAPARPALSYRR